MPREISIAVARRFLAIRHLLAPPRALPASPESVLAVVDRLGSLQFDPLEVAGRKTGKIIRFPLAMTVLNGERYLVAMLGEHTNWVFNVRAAGGKARLVHGLREQVLLEEVAVSQRAPILKAYLQIAPGARPHIPVGKDAPLAEFEKIAPDFPVFRLETKI